MTTKSACMFALLSCLAACPCPAQEAAHKDAAKLAMANAEKIVPGRIFDLIDAVNVQGVKDQLQAYPSDANALKDGVEALTAAVASYGWRREAEIVLLGAYRDSKRDDRLAICRILLEHGAKSKLKYIGETLEERVAKLPESDPLRQLFLKSAKGHQ